MGWIKRLFWGKDLREHLNESKQIKVMGMRFTIKRIDPLVYMNGSRVMREMFAKYKVDKNDERDSKINVDEIKKHYIDVLMAAVTEPELSRKQGDGDKIFVEYLFTDWALAAELYEEIMMFTYGKKKTKLRTSRATK